MRLNRGVESDKFDSKVIEAFKRISSGKLERE